VQAGSIVYNSATKQYGFIVRTNATDIIIQWFNSGSSNYSKRYYQNHIACIVSTYKKNVD
jgi:hypothetical protein